MQNKEKTPPSYSDSTYLTLSLPALNKENNFSPLHCPKGGSGWVETEFKLLISCFIPSCNA